MGWEENSEEGYVECDKCNVRFATVSTNGQPKEPDQAEMDAHTASHKVEA